MRGIIQTLLTCPTPTELINILKLASQLNNHEQNDVANFMKGMLFVKCYEEQLKNKDKK